MIRVAVIDDHPIVLDGIAANLEQAEDIILTARGKDADDALRIAQSGEADVVVLDLELPGKNALAIIPDIKSLHHPAHIVVFSAFGGPNRIADALASGADSYVVKGTSFDELLTAIRSAYAGKRYLSPEIASQVALVYGAPERLTQREREILSLLAQGQANKEIGERLNITERTVKFHVSRILARLGASNRAHAITIAQERGLL
ncbi:MAG: response regulator transcription factor [Candidatus Eremiobacteraeota bacterium]|nr:response regulator transcription factor [Candidatus Eremiobacteraeota bacterium]